MDVSGVSTSVSEAALEFCTKHVHVSSHLSIHGSITMVTDYETSIGFYSRDCHNVKGRYMKKYDVNNKYIASRTYIQIYIKDKIS